MRVYQVALARKQRRDFFGFRVKLPLTHFSTRWRLHTVLFSAEHQTGNLWIPILIVFGLTRRKIEPRSTASVADALSTRPLIDNRAYRIFKNVFQTHILREDTVRYTEIRPALQAIMCRHAIRFQCTRGSDCHFAHSLVERDVWAIMNKEGLVKEN